MQIFIAIWILKFVEISMDMKLADFSNLLPSKICENQYGKKPNSIHPKRSES
jgi:hypothetical protein